MISEALKYAVRKLVAAEVRDRSGSLVGPQGPAGKDGKDGRDGQDGRPGTGKDGSPGKDGAPGKSVEEKSVKAWLKELVADFLKKNQELFRGERGLSGVVLKESMVVKDGSTTIEGARTINFSGAAVSGGDDVANVSITGGSGAWGAISGTLSDQTDLQSALDAKASLASLATVATSGAYADLSGRPTLGSAAAAATTDFDAAGAATAAVATHVGLADPHTQYALESALGTAAAAATTDFLSSSTTSTQTGAFGDIKLKDDTTPSHYLILTDAENLTADHTLSLSVGNADRSLTLGGNTTLNGGTHSGTNTGDQTITLTSDVTGAGTGSFATTIANNAVTDAKFRQGVARSVVGVTGNATANTADIQGTTDQVLRINGAGTAAAFGAIDLSKAAAATGVLQAASFPALTGDVTTSAGALATTIGAAKVTRAMLEATGKNWQFLGQGTASGAVRTGTITWSGTFKQLLFEYFISGYSNNAIGRLIVGPTAGLSETGTTFCTSLIEGVTITATSVSVPGWPTAVTVANVARYGWMYVDNVASVVKRMSGHGQHSGTAPTTVPTQMRMEGMFNDTTNLINKAELAVYAAITGATISAITFNAGTYLNVWGRNDD